jgi:hypothetical protein
MIGHVVLFELVKATSEGQTELKELKNQLLAIPVPGTPDLHNLLSTYFKRFLYLTGTRRTFAGKTLRESTQESRKSLHAKFTGFLVLPGSN